MARRVGIILATAAMALLVTTDGAWACKCLTKIVKHCKKHKADGHKGKGHHHLCGKSDGDDSDCCDSDGCQSCCEPGVGETTPPAGPEVNPTPVPVIPPTPPAKPEQSSPPEPPKLPGKISLFHGSNDVNTLRMWSDASGKHQVEARFVGFQDGVVRLQKADGSCVRIAYRSLSLADQDFVRHQDPSLLAAE